MYYVHVPLKPAVRFQLVVVSVEIRYSEEPNFQYFSHIEVSGFVILDIPGILIVYLLIVTNLEFLITYL